MRELGLFKGQINTVNSITQHLWNIRYIPVFVLIVFYYNNCIELVCVQGHWMVAHRRTVGSVPLLTEVSWASRPRAGLRLLNWRDEWGFTFKIFIMYGFGFMCTVCHYCLYRWKINHEYVYHSLWCLFSYLVFYQEGPIEIRYLFFQDGSK